MKLFLVVCGLVLAPVAFAQHYSQPQPYCPQRPIFVPLQQPVVVVEDEPLPPRQPKPCGVDWQRLSPTPRYWHRGQIITKQKAYELVGDKTLKDDSKNLSVTVISPDKALRDKVASEVLAIPEYKDKLKVQAYAPDARMLKDSAGQPLGFVTEGSPSVILQAPSGKELWRQSDWKGGATQFLARLRERDPDYSPDKTPTPNKPVPSPGPGPGPNPNNPLGPLQDVPPAAWLVGAGVALAFVLKKK